ncbi:MAG: 16S rRNA (uracil(1498)-N(3))-methyltransferase [Lachnospiraceae bacterium]|nr:16S rRNA (uracil(1498)-N(3))-methyltransferase [Lachnospiraceae bacterium]
MLHVFAGPEALTGEEVRIEGPDVNHIRNVLRMKPGDPLSVRVRGDRKEYLCRITEISQQEVLCAVESARDADSELPSPVFLFQGLPKGDKMEWIIQKSVELGVTEIIPVRMERSIAKLDKGGAKTDRKTARWQAIAENAAQQSRRSIVPTVHAPMDWDEALAYGRQMAQVRYIPYENQQGSAGLREQILQLRPGEGIAVYIGPEGGISPDELRQAQEEGVQPVTLGRRILRTETAPLVFLSWLVLAFEIE